MDKYNKYAQKNNMQERWARFICKNIDGDDIEVPRAWAFFFLAKFKR